MNILMTFNTSLHHDTVGEIFVIWMIQRWSHMQDIILHSSWFCVQIYVWNVDNMIKDDEPVWKEGLYTSYGKWMDGWESRRRRTAGHDWSIVKLGIRGNIRAIEVDTAYFTGNFSPKISIQGQYFDDSIEMQQLHALRNNRSISRGDEGMMGTCASSEDWEIVSKLRSEEWPKQISTTTTTTGTPNKTSYPAWTYCGKGHPGNFGLTSPPM